jgi:Flp pilus assembly protein TadD
MNTLDNGSFPQLSVNQGGQMARHWWIATAAFSTYCFLAFCEDVNAQSVAQGTEKLRNTTQLAKVNKRVSAAATSEHATEALNAYKDILGSPVNDPIMLNNLGVRLSNSGRYLEASVLIGKAVDIAPHSATFLTNALRHQRAIECFERRGSPSNLDSVSLSNFSQSLLAEGEKKRALRLLREAALKYPDDKAVLNGLGMALYKSKKYSESVRTLKRLVSMNPDQGEFRYNLVLAQIAMNQRSEALRNYSVLKKARPKLAKALYKVIFHDRILDVSENKR